LLQAIDDSQHPLAGELYQRVFGEVHRIAVCLLRRQQGHTLSATVLVNDAFMRLIDGQAYSWTDRRQFYRLMTGVMRHVLARHHRRRRPASMPAERLDRHSAAVTDRVAQFELTDAYFEALRRLREEDPHAADAYEEYRFGDVRLTLEEDSDELIVIFCDESNAECTLADVAAALGLPISTVQARIKRARVRIRRYLKDFVPDGGAS
jgi:RNA polymerase sigma factor (sigma-70 family)